MLHSFLDLEQLIMKTKINFFYDFCACTIVQDLFLQINLGESSHFGHSYFYFYQLVSVSLVFINVLVGQA